MPEKISEKYLLSRLYQSVRYQVFHLFHIFLDLRRWLITSIEWGINKPVPVIPDEQENTFFTREHVWLRMTDDFNSLCGITSHMLESFSQVLFIDLPQVNMEVDRDEKVATLESHLDIYYLLSPVSGRIVKINSELFLSPGIINSDPFGKGWLFEIELKYRYQLDDLLDYEKYLEEIDFW
jgi:glycine cleavage system H protein